MAENIVVQGERMKDVIVQIQDELYPSQGAGNLVHYDRQALPATAGPKTAALLEPSRRGGREGGFPEAEEPPLFGKNMGRESGGYSGQEGGRQRGEERQSARGAVTASGVEARDNSPRVLTGRPEGGIEASSEGHATVEGSAKSAERLRNGASTANEVGAESSLEGTKPAERPASKSGASSPASEAPPKAAQQAPPAASGPAESEIPHLPSETGGPSSAASSPRNEAEPEPQTSGGAFGPSSTPRNISELTESLLAIEKDAQMVDVADVLSQLVTACTPIAQYKQLTLEHVGPPPGVLPLVAAEPHAVRQVLSIVLDNALR